MNERMFLLLACSRLYTTSMYNIDVPYLTHLRMKASIAHMNTYLPTYFSIPHSIFSHREEGKEKKKKDVIDLAL